jgi:hypothetical protein
MAIISLDSPSCEVPCWILRSVVYRDVTRQAKGLYRLKYEVTLKRGLAYLSRCNLGWFCHKGALDGVDLSVPSEDRTRALRQEVNYAVAHSLHRHSESLVNASERVALRVF